MEEALSEVTKLDAFQRQDLAGALRDITTLVHERNVEVGWWSDLKTSESLKGKRNFGELTARRVRAKELQGAAKAMSHRIGNTIVICPEPDAVCEMCGKTDELRPYGPRGERICFDCGQKNPEVTERQMDRFLFGGNIQ
jgi:hypothetical protein